MTDVATALADTSKLPDYGGKPVVRTAIKITNAGDGLSQGLSIDPEVLALGARHYVVLECIVDSHEHDRIMAKDVDTGLLVLNQVLKAGTGTLIDADVVRDAIAEQAAKIERAREAAKGIAKLPYPDELERQHDEGTHAEGLIEGCPKCDAEVAARQAEADQAATEAADEQRVHDAEAAAAAGDPPPDAPTPIAGRRRGR